MPSELSRVLAKEEWSRATELVKLHPCQASVWSKREGFFDGRNAANVLPLHEALVGHAPYDCIVAIFEAYPRAIMERESSYGRLPLHCACRKGADAKIVAYLAESYIEACLAPDNLDRLPIHYALSNGADREVINFLLSADPRQARGVDHRGWTPLHVACSLAAPEDVVKSILEIYPESVLHKTTKGHHITSCLPKGHPHRDDIEDLLLEAEEKVESSLHLDALRRRTHIEKLTYL